MAPGPGSTVGVMAAIVALIEGQEWVIVAVVVLVLFGGSRLPQLARSIGQAQKEFKKGLAEGNEDDDKPKDAAPPGASQPVVSTPEPANPRAAGEDAAPS
jgi:sec-independent protein translocase protein TatA